MLPAEELNVQVIRVGIALGIAISMVWYERYNLSPGGVIVPGMVAIFLIINPVVIIYTLIVSLATCLCTKFVSNYVILFGRRRFAAVMLLSFGFVWLMETITGVMATLNIGFQVIGFIIPGLIANEMERQGTFQTLYTLGIISIITFLLLFVLVGWG